MKTQLSKTIAKLLNLNFGLDAFQIPDALMSCLRDIGRVNVQTFNGILSTAMQESAVVSQLCVLFKVVQWYQHFCFPSMNPRYSLLDLTCSSERFSSLVVLCFNNILVYSVNSAYAVEDIIILT